MITRRANVFFSFLFSLLLVACGGSGSGAGDTVVDFLRAIERDDQEQVRELFLHSEVYPSDRTRDNMESYWNFLMDGWAERIADGDGIDSIRVVSEQTVETGSFSDAVSMGGQIQRVETRITFGDGSQLEVAWILAMAFERYRFVEIAIP